MAIDNTAEDIIKILEFLQKTKGFDESTDVSSKGVIKDGGSTNVNDTLAREISNIVKDQGKVSGSLTSAEESRYTAIFRILKKVLMPGPEADTLKGIKGAEAVNADKTQTNARNKKKVAAGLGAAAAAAALAGEDGNGTGIKDMLTGMLKPVMAVLKPLLGGAAAAAGFLGLRGLYNKVFGRGQGGGQGGGKGTNRTKPFRDKQGRLRSPDGSKLKKSKLLKALKFAGKGGIVGLGLSVFLDQFFPDWETELGEMLGEKAVLGFIKAKNGQVDGFEKEKKRKAKYQKTLDQFDRDRDGMLSENERMAARRFYAGKREREQLRKQIEESESKLQKQSAGGGETYYLGGGQLDSLGVVPLTTPSEVKIKGSEVFPASPSANVTFNPQFLESVIRHIGERVPGGVVNEANKLKVIDKEDPKSNTGVEVENIQQNIPKVIDLNELPMEIKREKPGGEVQVIDPELSQINNDQLNTLYMIRDGIQKLVALQGGRTKPPISLTTETISEALTPNTYAPVGAIA